MADRKRSRPYNHGPVFSVNPLSMPMSDLPKAVRQKRRKLLHTSAHSFRIEPSTPGGGPHVSSNLPPTFNVFSFESQYPCESRAVLKRDFDQRKAAAEAFPPTLNDSTTRESIGRYQEKIARIKPDITHVCATCGLFVPVRNVRFLNKGDSLFGGSINRRVFAETELDCCARNGDVFSFCSMCFASISESKHPKFGSVNAVNVTFCQAYPAELKNLTPVEEAMIARAHPVISILKLRPGGRSNPTVSYQRIRGHAVVIPQNPGPLLDILPSRSLALHEVIRIVWASERPHTTEDIRPFANVRKQKVLSALHWLKRENPLYRGIVIDFDLVGEWADEFVPTDLADRVLHGEPDHSEKQGYTADLDGDNYEDDFHHAVDEAGLDDSSTVLSGCLYTDADQIREHPTSKFISAITNQRFGNNTETDGVGSGDTETDTPLLTYQTKGRAVPLNDWEDPSFFSAAFPTLFPFGVGGHLSRSRVTKVSIDAWAQWALSHHSRRFARHPAFLFLVYDVISRRRSALGYHLLTKKTVFENTHDRINNISYTQIERAATEIKSTGKCTDPAILTLERQVQVVATHAPNSHAKCYEHRNYMNALMVKNGMPILWITLNPSDLKNPLVLTLAGVEHEIDSENGAAAHLHSATATMNPVAVAQFFQITCSAIFNELLGAGSKTGGLFGPISSYFGTVETNGRGMLHLHCLVWLKGASHLEGLQHRLKSEPEFAERVVEFIDSIIKCSIVRHGRIPDENPPVASLNETTTEFARKLAIDSNAVASKRQMHSTSHNSTCFKYGAAAKGQCRFQFPRPLVEKTHVENDGSMEIERNDPWVNAWNAAFASIIRSNHDITWILSNVKALALVRYITNYATKGDCTLYQRAMAILFVMRALDNTNKRHDVACETSHSQQENENTVTSSFPQLLGETKLALRVYNRLAHDCEISGPLAASTLLNLPEFYTPGPLKSRHIMLNSLRRKFPSIIFRQEVDEDDSNTMQRVGASRKPPTSLFDDYQWRGLRLEDFSLYDYAELISTVGRDKRGPNDISFSVEHPYVETKFQHPVPINSSSKFLVTPMGSLTTTNEDIDGTVQEGNIETDTRQNAVGLILLGLFVPWGRLPARFEACNASLFNFNEFCWQVWSELEPDLDEYTQFYAENILQTRKSQTACQIDREKMKAKETVAGGASHPENAVTDEDDDNESTTRDQMITSNEANLDDDNLSPAAKLAQIKWKIDIVNKTMKFSVLSHSIHAMREGDKNDNSGRIFRTLMEGRILSIEESLIPRRGVTKTTPALTATINNWKAMQDTARKQQNQGENNEEFDSEQAAMGESSFSEVALELMVGSVDISLEMRNFLDQHPLPDDCDCIDVVNCIQSLLPLNSRQQLIVAKVMDHVIQSRGQPACTDANRQMLLCVRGEGGVGKTRVVEAIKLGFTLLRRLKELVLTAPTGAAASNIGGSTIHAALGIHTPGRKNSKVISNVWNRRTALIVDEMSMISLKMLAEMDSKTREAKGDNRDSSTLFGGLSLVVLMGDFFQFPPVGANALWDEKLSHSEVEKRGEIVWRNFQTTVMTLTEQMRQKSDLQFQALLKRARNAELTQEDVDTLNRRVATNLPSSGSLDEAVIMQANDLRHITNRIAADEFVNALDQDITLFPDKIDGNTKNGEEIIPREDVLVVQDGNSVTGPGLLPYSYGMPAAVLVNQCTKHKIVNGTRAKMYGVIADGNSKCERLDSRTLLCSKPALCVLLQKPKPLDVPYQGLPPEVFPVFPARSTLTFGGGVKIGRKQIPLTPAFALTEYKVQGATFKNAVLDLKRPGGDTRVRKSEGQHRQFCSVYVQLSRLETLEGVRLLEPIEFADINNKPHPSLLKATAVLDEASERTFNSWSAWFEAKKQQHASRLHCRPDDLI